MFTHAFPFKGMKMLFSHCNKNAIPDLLFGPWSVYNMWQSAQTARAFARSLPRQFAWQLPFSVACHSCHLCSHFYTFVILLPQFSHNGDFTSSEMCGHCWLTQKWQRIFWKMERFYFRWGFQGHSLIWHGYLFHGLSFHASFLFLAQ